MEIKYRRMLDLKRELYWVPNVHTKGKKHGRGLVDRDEGS